MLVALSILMLVRLAKEILWRGDILHQRRRAVDPSEPLDRNS